MNTVKCSSFYVAILFYFTIITFITETHQYIKSYRKYEHIHFTICVKDLKNDDDVLAVEGEDKNIAWETYHQEILNIVFSCNKNSTSEAHSRRCISLMDKDKVRESISKMKDGKAVVPSRSLSDMVKATGAMGLA